ncbi:MAG TPA: hypothetical protein VFG67_06505 [Oleiagrimonas sp.]|nr:hypothetical protein [Oleiagrimonas sp.]HET8554481.1 hypothetical protein [Rhodanobacteraceae bacterium]
MGESSINRKDSLYNSACCSKKNGPEDCHAVAACDSGDDFINPMFSQTSLQAPNHTCGKDFLVTDGAFISPASGFEISDADGHALVKF